jgi:hypothetical protein
MGQPELGRKLESPEFRQLKQRIALRCTLRSFTPEETSIYVSSRMERAGLPAQTIIGAELVKEIHFRAQGIPRLINALCDNLLLTAFAMESRTATIPMLDEVTADMRLDYPGQLPFQPETDLPRTPGSPEPGSLSHVLSVLNPIYIVLSRTKTSVMIPDDSKVD